MKTLLLVFTLWGNPEFEERLFQHYLQTGKVIAHEDNDYDTFERPMYYILVDNSTAIEYAYKGEVLNWIRTGEFQYNDFLND